MTRTKGSKNKSTTIEKQSLQIEQLQEHINELERQYNTYDDVVDAFIDGFVMDLCNNGKIKTVNLDTLQLWFNNPDKYINNIVNLLTYYYIIDGNVFQLYDLIFSLPPLDYQIKVLKRDKDYKEDLSTINLYLEKKIQHKQLTRDLLVQLAHSGTLIGTWLGSKREPYFNVFNNLKYVFPYGRAKGKMVAVIDLQWFDEMSELERKLTFENLSPLITENKYKKWKEYNGENEDALRYIMLPISKTLVARIHTLSRNQRLGIPYGTQTLFDIQHKQKLRDLEQSIADKIIKAMAVLKFRGKDDNDSKVKESAKRKVLAGVKRALEKGVKDKNGIACIAMPDFATFEFPEIKNGDKTLDPKKYDSIDNDITNATGISQVLTNGTKGNYASAKLNLDVFYKKIGVMLEIIEEIYNQLIDIILGEEKGCNYIFQYNKDTPIEREKKLDTLIKLEAQGYSAKYVLDILGISSEEYFEESIYEIEKLKLREKIIPPLNTNVLSGKDGNDIGSPKLDDSDSSDATIESKERGI
ncbi:hypothetical protein G8S21_04940 [Clostridium botulinum C]|uniref:hypothetical protein n=1 Tax=Clostridium botulinum TaxID=1491 RepID=UPI001E3169E7|nr:hypothetical protein [Clostridium botulinum]MCD3245295.1 hypothetical protein [Clostridium botulinum C]MCD3261674.1 hypothetical protein [Clostridium botulinum C]